VHALIEMGWATSYFSSRRCLEISEQALRLSAKQSDPLMRARTRMSCLVQRLWADGWNQHDAEECRNSLEEIRCTSDDLRVVASHLVEYSFVQWSSSEYREARRSVVENLAILIGSKLNPYLAAAITVYQEGHGVLGYRVMPCLLFLGEWGDELREIEDAMAVMDKNGVPRSRTLRLYRA
jgi:hypothetical protein